MEHIVHVSNDFEPITGGINTHLKNLLTCLRGYEFEVTLLVPTVSKGSTSDISDCREISSKPFRVVRCSYKKTDFKPLNLLRLTRTTREGLQWIANHVQEIDLIHQHDQRATRLGASSFSSTHTIPLTWTNHSLAYFEKDNYVLRRILKMMNYKPDGMIAVHRPMAELFQKTEFSDVPVRYIPNGVNITHFIPNDKRQSEHTIVLFPQRMVPIKGAEILAKAAVTVLHNCKNKPVSFWFAGSEYASNRDERSIQKVREILSDFMDTDSVKFLGNPTYEEMPWYYYQADIVVLPLQVETENISVFEAWASGTPLITTCQVEKNGYVRDEENCVIVADRNPGALAEAILHLSFDTELREKLISNGRVLVEDRFTWDHTAGKTARFYREILKSQNDEVTLS